MRKEELERESIYEFLPVFSEGNNGLVRLHAEFCLVAMDLPGSRASNHSNVAWQNSRLSYYFYVGYQFAPKRGFQRFCRARKTFFL